MKNPIQKLRELQVKSCQADLDVMFEKAHQGHYKYDFETLLDEATRLRRKINNIKEEYGFSQLPLLWQ